MKNSLEEFKCDANEAIMFKLGKFLRPNKKYLCFRLTRPYLILLVKPRIFFRFSGKKINIKMPFKMHKILFFPIKIMCAYPFKKLTETPLFLFGHSFL